MRFTTLQRRPRVRSVLTILAATVASLLAAPDQAVSLSGPATTSTAPHPDWTASADSEQPNETPASNAIDGNLNTMWHTQYAPTTAPLPHTLTIDMHATNIVAGLRYQPRTDHPNGRIGNYQIHVLGSSRTWELVAAGTFADNTTAKVVRFPPIEATDVRLTAMTEAGNRGPWSSAAEINLIGSPLPELRRSGWTVTTDRQDTVASYGTNAIDGNPATMWNMDVALLPHTFTIDMRTTNVVSGLRYQPRTDGSPNGNIGQYQIHLSLDGTNWGNPVATGTFDDNAVEKTVSFTPSSTRYVRLTALTEAGNRGPYSAAAEINLTHNPIATVQCVPNAPIYSTRSNRTFHQHQHLGSETGANSWGTQRQIGAWGITARHIAGPNGIIYTANANGELRRMRWNGTTWDIFANGLNYEIIDTNPQWALYSTIDYFNRITVDANGDIYTVEPDGWLHWRRYNLPNRTWAHRLVASRWDDYDLIAGAGPGVVYARASGFQSLSRFEYFPESQRSRRWIVGDGWGIFSQIFSPGGDILYALRADTGDLMWYRYNANTEDWANGDVSEVPVGVRVGTGWQGNYETFAAPDSCRLSNTGWLPPTRPQITPRPPAPVTLMMSGDGHLHYSYVDSEGRAIYAEAAELTGGTPIRLAAIPGMTSLTGPTSTAEEEDQGRRIHIAANGLDAEVHSNTHDANNGPWGQVDTLGGFFGTPPVLFSKAETYPPFVVATAVDQNGLRWIRHPICVNGPHDPWSLSNDDEPDAPRLSNQNPLVVVPRVGGHSWHVIGQDNNGTLFAKADKSAKSACSKKDWTIQPSIAYGGHCVRGMWQSLGGVGFVGPASAVLVYASNEDKWGRLRVFATGSDGVIYTQREDLGCWFPGTWAMVSAGFIASGPPSATLAPDNKIKIVARSTDGLIYYTSQTAPDSTTFDPWQAISDTDESATDPTALAVPGSNTWVVAYRTDLDVPRLRRYVPPASAALADTSSAFVDVPMMPPA